ncbi:MAG: GAF domain-containing protein [Anaerolineales bacterium]|nr:GAF domain-containing protein [Anaerolineales bacterium]
MKIKNTRSLTTTLAISFFSLSAVALLISNSLQIALTIRTQQTEILAKQALIAQDTEKRVSDFIQGKFASMETAASFSNLATASYDERITALNGMLGLDPSFRQISMTSSGANLQAYVSRTSQTISQQFASQLTGSVYSALSMGEKFFVSPVYFDETTAEPLIALALPYKTVFGDYQGVLSTEVSLRFLWDLVDTIKVGETGYVYIVDNQGNLIAYKDRGRVLEGENVSNIFEVSEFVQDPSAPLDLTDDVNTYTGLSGETVLGTFVPLGAPQWAVVVELPQKEAYQNIVSLAWQSFALAVLIALLAALVGYLSAQRTAKPLIELSSAATAVANGNFNVQAKVAGAKEIIQLTDSFNNMTTQLSDSISNLEQRVTERTEDLQKANQQNERRAKQFEAIARVTRTISSSFELDILGTQITNAISREFGFYHVGIFLLDSAKEYAVLNASNSEGGQVMLQRGHRLKVGEKGMVGFVSSTGKPRVALDTGVDAVFFNNPDLPNTRSEITLPLRAGEDVIGVLDVQSVESNAFSREDVNILSILADQVSIAFQNARQNEETRRALAESDALSRQFVQTGWRQFTKKQNLLGVRHAGTKATILYSDEETKGKDQLLKTTKQATVKPRGGFLSLPIKLRGEVIGSVDIQATDNRQWEQDEMDIVTAIIERAAIAMENSRLLNEAQQRAAREQAIGEMSAKIGAFTETEAILRATVNEIGQKLRGARVVFELGTQDDDRKRSKLK